MVKKSFFLFALCACPIFPALSRFSYGLVFTLAFCVSFLVLPGIRKLISLCSLKKEYAFIIEILSLLLCTSFYSALVKLVCPLIAMAVEFFLYAVPFIYLLFDFLSAGGNADSRDSTVLTAIAFLPAFSLLRELLYFGTVSFPAVGEIYSLAIFSPNTIGFVKFFGSLPGSLILIGLILWMWNALTAKKSNSLRDKS